MQSEIQYSGEGRGGCRGRAERYAEAGAETKGATGTEALSLTFMYIGRGKVQRQI